ncbi:VOC family protein [Mycobacterium sp. CBMA271]|nr:hypothetical protein [Mycobacteroides sp. CBMA 326]MUM23284.1 VOC family protein [Mycobacteroides sp. CBMA 271]
MEAFYVLLPGTAAEALTFYRSVFGGTFASHSFSDFGRQDGPPGNIAHGHLAGAVSIHIADAPPDDPPLTMTAVSIALLGVSSPVDSKRWFDQVSCGGEICRPLVRRGWDAVDGTVRGRYGSP